MIILVDNFDSFTYNIAQALGNLGVELKVLRNDAFTPAGVESLAPRAIVISPGPGRPENSGQTCPLIKRMAGKVPILGICLGHQAIGQVMGARVERAPAPVHGKTSEIFHDGQGVFSGLRNPFVATRYHSLTVPEESVAPPLKVSAYTSGGEVMGLSARDLMVEGVQFHPESIATCHGEVIFKNFLDIYLDGSERAA